MLVRRTYRKVCPDRLPMDPNRAPCCEVLSQIKSWQAIGSDAASMTT